MHRIGIITETVQSKPAARPEAGGGIRVFPVARATLRQRHTDREKNRAVGIVRKKRVGPGRKNAEGDVVDSQVIADGRQKIRQEIIQGSLGSDDAPAELRVRDAAPQELPVLGLGSCRHCYEISFASLVADDRLTKHIRASSAANGGVVPVKQGDPASGRDFEDRHIGAWIGRVSVPDPLGRAHDVRSADSDLDERGTRMALLLRSLSGSYNRVSRDKGSEACCSQNHSHGDLQSGVFADDGAGGPRQFAQRLPIYVCGPPTLLEEADPLFSLGAVRPRTTCPANCIQMYDTPHPQNPQDRI